MVLLHSTFPVTRIDFRVVSSPGYSIRLPVTVIMNHSGSSFCCM